MVFEMLVKISADMTDSVKQKKPIQCPLFYGGFSFHIQGISNIQPIPFLVALPKFL